MMAPIHRRKTVGASPFVMVSSKEVRGEACLVINGARIIVRDPCSIRGIMGGGSTDAWFWNGDMESSVLLML